MYEAETSGPDPVARNTSYARSIVSPMTLATIIVVCAILFVAKALFLPLALGMLIVFILTPIVTMLRNTGLRDVPAVTLTVGLAAAMVAAFVLIFVYQISQIAANLPQYQSNMLTKIDSILDAGADNRVIMRVQQMVDMVSNRLADSTGSDDAVSEVRVVEEMRLKDWLTDVIIPAFTPIAIFGLIFVVVIFSLLERGALRDRLVQLIGGNNIVATSRLLAEASSRVSSYLLAQLVVNIIYAVPIGLGLFLLGVPNALFFALVTLVMRFVPYIGSVISAALPLLMAFAVSSDWSLVLWVAALFGVVELMTSNFIEPWFFGQRTGVSPLAVIVSAMFWTWLWGPLGLIIATPLTVCLVVIGHHVPSMRLFPVLLGDQPVLAESARLYDRLLAGRRFAFTEEATSSTRQLYLAEYYDQIAIPALVLAQADQQAGLLSQYQAAQITNAARDLTEELKSVVEDELASASEEAVEGAETLAANGILDGVGRKIAVFGTATELDDVAAAMVAQALRAEGAEVLAMPYRASLPGALSRALGGFEPETVVLVSLDPAPGKQTELQVRQLRRRLQGVKIGIALWRDGESEAQTTGQVSADFVANGIEGVMAAAFDKDEDGSTPK